MIVTETKIIFFELFTCTSLYPQVFPKVKLNSCCEYNISIEQKSSNFIKEKKGRR